MITLIILGILILYLVLGHVCLAHMNRRCILKTGISYNLNRIPILLMPYVYITSFLIIIWLFVDDIIRWKKYKIWKK